MTDLVLLGFSGSIGRQTLDVLKEFDDYKLKAISCNSDFAKAEEVKKAFPSLETIAIASTSGTKIAGLEVLEGEDAGVRLIRKYPKAVVINAVVGLAGLALTLEAIRHDCLLLLANKESLVIGGHLVKNLLKEHKKARIIPIDSEHSALLKLHKHEDEILKYIITCSGGALRDYDLSKLDDATLEDVLNHPTWSMGKRITIDCATMVNKAFEVIEASYLFDIPLSNIEVLMHDESLIHGLVYLKDNSYLAEIGPSDMRIPIAYALNKAIRKELPLEPLDIADLHFRRYNERRYPLFKFIIDNFEDGSSNMAVINAADEVAVEAFIRGHIKFGDIKTIITMTFKRVRGVLVENLDDILAISRIAKEEARIIINELKGS